MLHIVMVEHLYTAVMILSSTAKWTCSPTGTYYSLYKHTHTEHFSKRLFRICSKQGPHCLARSQALYSNIAWDEATLLHREFYNNPLQCSSRESSSALTLQERQILLVSMTVQRMAFSYNLLWNKASNIHFTSVCIIAQV